MTNLLSDCPVVLWFKRDLRLFDQPLIEFAIERGRPVILLYIFEGSVFHSEHYSARHHRFVWESIEEMRRMAYLKNHVLYAVESEAIDVFTALKKAVGNYEVVSAQEVGLEVTYKRDRQLKEWFHAQNIPWKEIKYSGIRRGLQSRKGFNEYWYSYMEAQQHDSDLEKIQRYENVQWNEWTNQNELKEKPIVEGITQKGGTLLAFKYLNSFLNERIYSYARSISKPEESRTGCSRISPYLAWGNISLRQVYQAQYWASKEAKNKRNFSQFASRLRWREHFMQKFESECEMEFVSVNRGYSALEYEGNQENIKRWREGNTGIPLVDACMRALNHTGYLNFRMRAMLVSFITHHLNESWEAAAAHLSKQFLDFEPGIHFPQIQMQAGITGTNTIRIYNPTKQAEEHDCEGKFIKKWVPELAELNAPEIFEPWKLEHPPENYTKPVVDLKASHKAARERLWGMKGNKEVRLEAQRILKIHT